jgi:hypothetical protein
MTLQDTIKDVRNEAIANGKIGDQIVPNIKPKKISENGVAKFYEVNKNGDVLVVSDDQTLKDRMVELNKLVDDLVLAEAKKVYKAQASAKKAAKPAPAKKKTAKKTSKNPKPTNGGNAKQNVQRLAQQVVEDGGEIIGFKIWWDMENVDGLRVDLESSLEAIGLGDCAVTVPPPATRMSIAGKRMAARIGLVFRRAGTANDHATFRAVKFDGADDNSQVNAEHIPTVDPSVLQPISVHIDTGAVSLGDPNCDIAKAVVGEYDRLETHFCSHDLTYTMLNIVDALKACRMRRRGGLYYVPIEDDQDAVEAKLVALTSWFQAIGTSDFYVEPVVKGAPSARSAGRTAGRTLDDDYKEILAAAQSFASDLSSGDLVNGRSLNAKVAAAKELRSKADLYREILADRGVRLAEAAKVVGGTMSSILDAQVEVRALTKASDSDRAQKLADEMIKEISEKVAKDIEAAKKAYAD